jgi:peptidoglycan hydrolase-like protein with peptidoglycan-binding domain
MKIRPVSQFVARAGTLLAIAVSTAFLSGCAGYSIGTPKPKLLVPVESLAVPNPKNQTLKPRIEVLAADSIIKQIQQDGTFKVATTDKADAVLETTITRIDRTPSRSVRGNVRATQEFRLIVEIKYTLTGAAGENLASGTVRGDTSFFVGSDVNEEERIAVPRAMEKAAIRLVSELSEGW